MATIFKTMSHHFIAPEYLTFTAFTFCHSAGILKLEPSCSVIRMLKNVPLDSYQAGLLMRK